MKLGNPIRQSSVELDIKQMLNVINDPTSRHSLLVLYLQTQIARILQLNESQIDVQQSASILGLDSLAAAELTYEVEKSTGVVLDLTDLLQATSISHLASQLLTKFDTLAAAAPVLLRSIRQDSIDKGHLSHGQRGMWFLQRLAPESTAYNIASAVRIYGKLNIPALRQAFQKVVERHPSLRTTFPAPQGEPMQQVHERVEGYFHLENAATWNEAELIDCLNKEAHRPFDLERDPLMRIQLFERQGEVTLLLVIHHIVADFWSLAILLSDLETLYLAENTGKSVSLPPLSMDYAYYAQGQIDEMNGAEGERLWQYWRQKLAGELLVLNLPTDKPRRTFQTYNGGAQTLKLPVELVEKFKAVGSSRDATLYMTLLAAFQVLLYRYTGQEDILVGSPTVGRNRAELAKLIGVFINLVTMRTTLTKEQPFTAVLDSVRQTVLDAFAHQNYPFDLLVEKLQPHRDASQSPIFQTMLIFQQTPSFIDQGLALLALGEADVRIQMGGLTLESIALDPRTAQVDLTLVAAESVDGLHLSMQYNSDLFEPATIHRMLSHFQILLEGIVAYPDQVIAKLPLLAEVERRQLLMDWNQTQATYPKDFCLHQLFETQAAQTPDAIAIVFEDEHLTYQELNARANQLANYLCKMGVGSETLVGVYEERSLEMIISLLGVLKTGGTYVPIDPEHPAERNTFVLKDAHITTLLTQEHLIKDFSEEKIQFVCLGRDLEIISQQDTQNLPVVTFPENLAYVIYTSGSTGKPKGVQISHRSVSNFLKAMQQKPGLTSKDIHLSVTTLSFDIAVLEIFLPLITGACVVIANREAVLDGQKLRATLTNTRATTMQATPTTWQLLLQTGWAGDHQLKIFCGGETFPRELANRLISKSGSLWNMYGPTETTVWSSTYPVQQTDDGTVSIGRPINNTQIYLLNTQLQPVPVGVSGRLFIGGDGLARGYFNRSALTAQKFIPNPYSTEPGSRLYDTGDLACYLSDGNIKFLGRADYQVKVRGFRIELGEIETVLSCHDIIEEAVVLVLDDIDTGKRLVAYVVSNNWHQTTVSELRRFLKDKLPDYMVPTTFMRLDALPRTPNGKVNRRALPVPSSDRPELATVYAAPKGDLEQILAQTWQQVLKVDKVGIHDNFFDLGGHSFLMAQIHHKLQESYCELSMAELFQYTTIHSLANYLKEINPEQTSLKQSQERIQVRSNREATMNQQRMRRQKNRTINR